jgi:hypothetical protein
MSYSVETLKAGVAAMSTRPFGERFAERLLELRYGLKRRTGSYDLTDGQERIEAKFSRIFAPVTGDTLLDFIVNSGGKRLGSRHERFTANFQKLHPDEFDVLYYGIVFDEGILVHRARREDVPFTNQHLNNETMKQFSIDGRTLASHDKHLVEVLDWASVLRLLQRSG